MFWEGVPDGPATLRTATEVEEFTYANGQREGPAVRKLDNGDTVQYNYIKGEIQGEASLVRADSGKEVFHFVNGVKEGLSEDVRADGSREERMYSEGRFEGQAMLQPMIVVLMTSILT